MRVYIHKKYINYCIFMRTRKTLWIKTTEKQSRFYDNILYEYKETNQSVQFLYVYEMSLMVTQIIKWEHDVYNEYVCLSDFTLFYAFPFPTRWWATTDRYTGMASATIICVRKELCTVNHSYRDCSSHETLKGQVHYLNLGYLCTQWKRWQVKPFHATRPEITEHI